jgi:hypothetical protein
MMLCDILEDSMQCPYTKWFVTGNCEIVGLSIDFR